MLAEAQCIIKTVDWLEEEINEKLLQLEAAVAYNKVSVAEVLRKQILSLNKKLTDETKNMDRFMDKYRSLIKYEKEAMVSYIRQKEQARLRSLPAQQRRTCSSSVV